MMSYVDEDSSTLAKILLLAYVIVSLILCGGSVFGFTALKEVFLDEGVYEDLCYENTNTNGTTTEVFVPCEDQLQKLDQMFTLAASLFSAYLMPAGLCLRFLGPRVCFLAGFAFVTTGSWIFAKASAEYFTMAYILIGTGNPLLYIAAFNFGKIYPQSSNLLLSIFIGCFGFSSVVFYMFHVLHFDFGWSSQELFEGFSFLPVALGVVGFFVLPPDPYHIQREKSSKLSDADSAVAFAKVSRKDADESSTVTETTPLVSSPSPSTKTADVETAAHQDTDTGDVVPLKDRSIAQQLQSPQFLAQTLFFCWGMLQQNFYLGTIGDQIYMMAGDDPTLLEETATILTNFALLYPIGCIVAILPVGALVRNCSVSTSLFVYTAANLLFSTLTLMPSVPLQWVTSELYVFVRVGFFTVMSTYSATIFGFKNLSTMFGFAGCFAGLCSLLGTFLSDRALHVDHSFFPVNCLLLAGALLSFAFPTVIYVLKWQEEAASHK
ncbi:expressed unknown protein [Seminavis robusta]|uniref:Uncharacterized protein n=1 Tax=Seminavis robusta TaxID=568900 RepID=A0A9N8HT26_9STRA|nr:expressed unknown protein [Seminavis robusta]|eukprot:Sro1811_g299170.1 n/a (493) ;mRNA; r:4489-5967